MMKLWIIVLAVATLLNSIAIVGILDIAQHHNEAIGKLADMVTRLANVVKIIDSER